MATCAAAASAVLIAAPAALAGPARVVRITQISQTPALPAECLDPNGGPPSSDQESQLAVDPHDPRHVAAVWYVEQPGVFGAKAARVAVSRDSGQTWQLSLQQGVDSCTGNAPYSVSGGHNATVAFGPDGRLYVGSQSGRAGARDAGGEESLWVSAADHGGATLGGPVSPMQSSPTLGITDQSRLTADPRKPGVVYLMTQVKDPTAYQTGNTYSGKSYFVRSADAGRTWSSPQLAYDPAGNVFRSPYGNSLSVLPDGTLLDVFSELNGSGAVLAPGGTNYPDRIYAIRSSDGGHSWSTPAPVVGEIAAFSSQLLVDDPDGKAQWLANTYIPPVAQAPDGETLYVAWADPSSDASPHATLHVARSSDGGVTWEQTAPVSTSTTAFMPAIAVAGDGRVGVLWYDLRRQRAGAAHWQTDVYFASSGDRGATWSEQRVSGPMDLRAAVPRLGAVAALGIGAGAIYLGDYNSLAGLPRGFAASYTVTSPLATDGATDIDYAQIDDGSAPAAPSRATRRTLALSVRPTRAAVREYPVTFRVVNKDRSQLPCPTDGQTYTIRGTLVEPADALATAQRRAATLYLHGQGAAGGPIWRQTARPGYDTARSLAERGHISIVIDRLGDVDALAVMGFADEPPGGDSSDLIRVAETCATGGRPKAPGKPSGWVDFLEALHGDLFAAADPTVVAAARASYERDPCAIFSSSATAIPLDQARAGSIHVPVLVMEGDHDILHPPDQGAQQAARYTGSPSVQHTVIPGAGHFLMLSTAAPVFQRDLSEWLTTQRL